MTIIGLVLVYKVVMFMFLKSEDKEKDEFQTGKIFLSLPITILLLAIFSFPSELKIRTVKSVKNIDTSLEKKDFYVRKGDYILEEGKVFKLNSTSEEVFGKDNWMSSSNTNYKEEYGMVDYINHNINSEGEASFSLPLPIVFTFDMLDRIFNGSHGNNGILEGAFGGLYYMLRVDPVEFFEILSRNGTYDSMAREELVKNKINTFIVNKGKQVSNVNQNLIETTQLYNNIPYVVYIHYNSEMLEEGLDINQNSQSISNLANVLRANNKYNQELREYMRNEFDVESYTPMVSNIYTNNSIFTNRNDRKLYDKYFSFPNQGVIDYDKLTVNYGENETPNSNVALLGKTTYLNIGVKDSSGSDEDIVNVNNRLNDFSTVLNITEKYNDDKEIIVPNAIYKKFLMTHREQLVTVNLMDKVRTEPLYDNNIYSYLYKDLSNVENTILNVKLEGNTLNPLPKDTLQYSQRLHFINQNMNIYFEKNFPSTKMKASISNTSIANFNEALTVQNKYIDYKNKLDNVLEDYIKDLAMKMSNGNGNEIFHETKIRGIINGQVVYINDKFKKGLEEIDKHNDILRTSLKDVVETKSELEWTRNTIKLKKKLINGDNLELTPLSNKNVEDGMMGDIKKVLFDTIEMLFGWFLDAVYKLVAFIGKYAFALILSLHPLSIIMITFTIFFLLFKAVFTNNLADLLKKVFILVLNFYLFVFAVLLASQLILSIAPMFLNLAIKFGRTGAIVEIIFIFFIFYFFSYVTKQVTKMTGGTPFMNLFGGVNKVNLTAAQGLGVATIGASSLVGGGAMKGTSKAGKYISDKVSGNISNPTEGNVSPQQMGLNSNPIQPQSNIGSSSLTDSLNGNSNPMSDLGKSGQTINNTTINNNVSSSGLGSSNMGSNLTNNLSDALNGISEDTNPTNKD